MKELITDEILVLQLEHPAAGRYLNPVLSECESDHQILWDIMGYLMCTYCIADEESFESSWICRRVDWYIRVTGVLEVPAASIFTSVAICQSTYLHMPDEFNFVPDSTC